ncbi:hypothetical protein [Methylobacter sp.]|uniref:hypothetical protein n=1 Tax=Methylobacter sp. TaxID=2051955 RepID=UPI002FDD9432
MQDRGLTEFKSFTGHLQAGGDIMPITFLTLIDMSGEVKFDFSAIALTKETSFIMKYWDGEGSRPGYFSLSGKAEDGTEFKTEDLHFISLSTESNEETGSRMIPIGGCLRAEFRRKLATPTPKPLLRMYIKGFQNFGQLSSTCCLGRVEMDGYKTIEDPDFITGYITIQSDNEPIGLAVWHAEADKLLEHIRRLMSFASGVMLLSPIIKFYSGDHLEVIALSQSRQASAHSSTFHYLNQQPIFDAAVASFYNPPFEIKNLFFAIEWFAMESSYNEIRLINAMTALENLIASNLENNDKFIQSEKEFEKTRRKLRTVIRQCIEKWQTDDSNTISEIVKELNEKLADLNRRSIRQKLSILVGHWQIPLDGIDEDKIKAAITARNLIVHRGHYYDADKESSGDDLWDHATVVREIVVRFILTAIGYRGDYISYVGGYHYAQFPPQSDVSDAN